MRDQRSALIVAMLKGDIAAEPCYCMYGEEPRFPTGPEKLMSLKTSTVQYSRAFKFSYSSIPSVQNQQYTAGVGPASLVQHSTTVWVSYSIQFAEYSTVML